MSSYVNLPEHCRSLFLGDLSCYCHEQDIYNAFKSYGEIESIRLMRGKDNRVLGYGFITFVDVRSTIAAQAMNGTVVVGRPLK
jgi:RNA recognition motif-containing protein